MLATKTESENILNKHTFEVFPDNPHNLAAKGVQNCRISDAIKVNFKKQDKINVSIYADDFIIADATKEVLENKVQLSVENFLNERGLELLQ